MLNSQASFENGWDADCEKQDVGRDVEHSIDDLVVLVCGALHYRRSAHQICVRTTETLTVRWRDSPVLPSGSADSEQRKLVTNEGDHDPDDECVEEFALSRSITGRMVISTDG